MGCQDKDKLVDIVVEFIRIVETVLPIDVVNALSRLTEVEEGLAREIALAMTKNVDLANRYSIPICQDTGTLEFFVKLGLRSPFANAIDCVLREAVEKATRAIPLRPNAVNPFTNVNSGNNVGRYIPWISYEVDGSQDVIEVWLYVAGGGSSSASEVKVLNPIGWEDQLIEFVLDSALKRGVNACPPIVLGIGIGPTIEIASTLSKKALLRDIGRRNAEPRVAKLEEKIREALNSLGLGPQGFNGKTFALDVFIEYAYRHPATLAVALSYSCWVYRKGCLRLYPDMSYEIPTHGLARVIHG